MARKLEVQIVGDARDLEKAFGRASNSTSAFGKSLKVAAIGAAAAGAAVGAGLAIAAKKAMDFEREMRNVNSIAHLTERQFEQVSDAVLDMAREVGQKPRILAQGMYELTSSGFKANDAVRILKVSAKAASAGLTDTATSTKAVAAALNAYHLKAKDARKVSDVLFQTVNKGVLTFEELAQNMGDLVPAAAPLGVSLEEVGASIATITLQGVPAAEAATRVKNSMLQLAKPSKALSGLLREAGYESGEAAVKAVGFSGVLQMLQKATQGSVTETAKLTPEIRALLGVVGLTGKNLETYEKNLRAMDNASKGGGATQAAFAEQSKSVSMQLQKLSAGFEVLAIKVGAALLPHLNALLTWTNKHWPEIEAVVEGTIRAIEVAIRTVAPIIAVLIASFQRLAIFARQHWGEVQEAADRVMRWYNGVLKPAVQTVLNAIQAFWARFGDAITRIVRVSLGNLITVVRTVLANIASVVNAILAILRGDWQGAWNEIKEIPGRSLRAIVSIIKGFGSILFTVGKEIVSLLKDGIVSGLAAMKDAVVGAARKYIVDPLKSIVPGWGSTPYTWARDDIGKAIVAGAIDGLTTAGLPEKMRQKVDEAIEAARSAIESKRSVFAQAAQSLVDAALSAFDRLSSEIETRSERKLRLMDEKARKQGLKEDIAQARAALADAQSAMSSLTPKEGETAEDYTARINEAKAAITAAQKQLDDALLAQQRYALEQRAAQERKALDEKRALKRRHLEEELAAANSAYERGRISFKQYNERLVALMKEYQIPFKKGAASLGGALAEGLRDAFKGVQAAAKALADAIVTELSKVRVIIDVDLSIKNPGQQTQGRAAGGPVRSGTPYVVGENGPELFVPSMSGTIVPNGGGSSGYHPAGGGGITLNFNGPVHGRPEEYAAAIRDEFLRMQRRGIALGFS